MYFESLRFNVTPDETTESSITQESQQAEVNGHLCRFHSSFLPKTLKKLVSVTLRS
jgi:hypothetical protein